jgi:hypothetical protein
MVTRSAADPTPQLEPPAEIRDLSTPSCHASHEYAASASPAIDAADSRPRWLSPAPRLSNVRT